MFFFPQSRRIGEIVGIQATQQPRVQLNHFPKSAVAEIASKGVTLNIVSPGFVNTPMLQKYGDHIEKIVESLPTSRLAEPDEVSNVVSMLMSETSGYINGANINIDGGVLCTLSV